MNTFYSFVPQKSHNFLQCWVDELKIDIRISNPRKTKLGDFKVINNVMQISINNDLNPYSFLITLTHELAHAFVYLKYGPLVKPHGVEWKNIFKSLMLNFINQSVFPDELLRLLSGHLINPKASTMSDIKLSSALRKYDFKKSNSVSDISYGGKFLISDGRKFIKGKLLRKRYECIEFVTGKTYHFHPLTKVDII